MTKTTIIQMSSVAILIGIIIAIILISPNKTTQPDEQPYEQSNVAVALDDTQAETSEPMAGTPSPSNETINDNTQQTMEQKQSQQAIITTNKGVITLDLYSELAPKTVENFKTLASEGFYDGTRFHRIIEGFMIQGGDPLSKDTDAKNAWGTGGPDYRFEDEIHEQNINSVGTIAMANAGPHTNGSQFFINVADNNFLDTKHTVFGEVVDDMDVIRSIEAVDTDERDRPVEDVIIESIQVTNQ